jgi:hypothetical protein
VPEKEAAGNFSLNLLYLTKDSKMGIPSNKQSNIHTQQRKNKSMYK